MLPPLWQKPYINIYFSGDNSLISQCFPLKPFVHEQSNECPFIEQEPPFLQGFGLHTAKTKQNKIVLKQTNKQTNKQTTYIHTHTYTLFKCRGI